MVIGTYETRNFSFVIVGQDQEHVVDLMREAWRVHCQQYGAEEEYFRAEDMNMTQTAERFVVIREGSGVILAGDYPSRPADGRKTGDVPRAGGWENVAYNRTSGEKEVQNHERRGEQGIEG